MLAPSNFGSTQYSIIVQTVKVPLPFCPNPAGLLHYNCSPAKAWEPGAALWENLLSIPAPTLCVGESGVINDRDFLFQFFPVLCIS